MIVSLSNNDAVLALTDRSGDPGFVGYELERSIDGGAWVPWTGSVWGGIVGLLSSHRFTDYSLSPGIYQYRARARYGVAPDFTYSEWEVSAYERIASASGVKTGWTFGNYAPLPGEFGDVLTPDDLRYTYLWGVPFTSSKGEEYTDPQIRAMIDAAVREFELALTLTIKKRVIKCRSGLQDGAVYDELEDPYAYHRHHWNSGGQLLTRRRPLLSVESMGLYTITDQKIIDLIDWLRIDHNKGVVHFYPRTGPQGTMRVSPSFLSYNYLATRDYPAGYRIDYTAGFADASKVPPELRDIIGKAAACRLLNIIGDGLIAGFSSASVSMDGLSESFSTTQSATNAFYGARIGVYLKDIESFLKENRRKYKSMPMGSI